jgi:hypothetical protein
MPWIRPEFAAEMTPAVQVFVESLLVFAVNLRDA